MVFRGTAVTYGRGRAVVVATGMKTEMGRIAGMLKEAAIETTPLQKELDRTGKLLGAIVVIIAIVMIVTIILVEDVTGFAAVFDVLILGIALAVAAVPEGLPTVMTAVLSVGVQRMAQRKAIVRHLPAVETLGSANVIASDKTGTLTKNEMTVKTLVTASGCVQFGGVVSAAGTLLMLDASLPGGLIEGFGTMRYAQTMAFTTLVFFSIFSVFNARSDERSACEDFFSNHWLWGAIALSIVLQFAVIYVPLLQEAFSTVSLSFADWIRCLVVASSVLWLREVNKVVTRVRMNR
jgi:magnesium-transporting ATPase (P-type)